jgi:starvation-inducible DNA-binding protein
MRNLQRGPTSIRAGGFPRAMFHHQLERRDAVALDIGLSDKQRAALVDMLNTLLADEFVLYVKTRRFHWNVTGVDFSELHKLFQEQYEALDKVVDEVAERARALDGVAAGSLKEYLAATRLNEAPGTNPEWRGMVEALLQDHQSIIRQLRKDIPEAQDKHGDAGTADFLTGLMEQHEKTAWMLRAYLK